VKISLKTEGLGRVMHKSDLILQKMHILVLIGMMLSSILVLQCLGESALALPINKPPVIVVTSPIKGEINRTVNINASVSDPDGNITSITWNQEDEFPPVNMSISHDKQAMSFIPTQNVTYVFTIEAIDNSGSTTSNSVQVNVGK
jgi:K319L-like, PKD domain